MEPLVSVVIPCYGQAHFLADAIESVLAQTHLSHEIIVVNDGSPDTPELERVLGRFQAKLTYVRQENCGLGAARNSGLKLSTGAFAVFLDADDRLLPNALATGAEALSARPDCPLAWGFNRPIDVNGNPLPYATERAGVNAGYGELLAGNFIGPPVGVMFRRAQLADIGGFSVSVRGAEDYDAYLRLAQRHDIFCHGVVVAEYRRHDANMSRDHQGMLRGTLEALDGQVRWIGEEPRLLMALRAGRRRAQEDFDWNPRIKLVYRALRDRRWTTASVGGAGLLLRYPGRSARIIGQRLLRVLPLQRA